MNKCALEKIIDHKKVDEKYKELLFCPNFEKEGNGGMKFTGIVCTNCCIRVQMVADALSGLILRGEFSLDELKERPDVFYSKLSPKLREYAETVSKETGKSWFEIKNECQRCKPTWVNSQEVPDEVEVTEMTSIARSAV